MIYVMQVLTGKEEYVIYFLKKGFLTDEDKAFSPDCELEKKFRGDCSVGALAHQVGYSEDYLSRYFMHAVGMSYHSYVIQYRLGQACHLLRNTDEPILQCAMDSGFTSLRSFNRNFSLYISMTPTEYRENQTVFGRS